MSEIQSPPVPDGAMCGVHPAVAALAVCDSCGSAVCRGCTVGVEGVAQCRACTTLQRRPAGMPARVLAGIVDYVVTIGLLANGSFLAGLFVQRAADAVFVGMGLGLVSLVLLIANSVLTLFGVGTAGRRLCGVAVISADGRQPSFLQRAVHRAGALVAVFLVWRFVSREAAWLLIGGNLGAAALTGRSLVDLLSRTRLLAARAAD